MRVFGVDFTSSPAAAKPLTVAVGTVRDDVLAVERVDELTAFAAYEHLLATPGPWVAAVDHPFGLPAAFVDAMGWPATWAGYVGAAAKLDRTTFRQAVTTFTSSRPAGDRYLPRGTEEGLGAASPLNVVNPPVGLMFHEGAPRLRAAGVDVVPCRRRPSDGRVVAEGYPGAVARRFLGRRPYKRGTWQAGRTRMELLDAIGTAACRDVYGVTVAVAEPARGNAVLDGQGDLLDAVLCALQAAWLWRTPAAVPRDPLSRREGWIADPR